MNHCRKNKNNVLDSSWGDKLEININDLSSIGGEFNIKTNNKNIKFKVKTGAMCILKSRLSFYIKFNKEFLDKLDGGDYSCVKEMGFPKKSEEQEAFLKEEVLSFNRKKDEKIPFKKWKSNLLSLRSGGADEYSYLSYEKLCDMVSSKVFGKVDRPKIKWVNKKSKAKMLRWYLRGLSIENAIKKVLYEEHNGFISSRSYKIRSYGFNIDIEKEISEFLNFKD